MTVRLLLLLAALLVPLTAWAGTVRIGVFVGNNVGFGTDEPLRYAEREARDLASVFQDLGGLSRDRTYVLAGSTAGELKETVTRVEAHIREAQARGDGVMLLFYYSGHASGDGLHMAGTLLPMPYVRKWLETSGATARIGFVDACESGTLARVKGGAPVEAIDLTVDDALTAYGYAVVTSSGPLSVARESEQFGGGVFSRALLTGLRGSADTDGDGGVTLEEVYNYAFAETVVRTASMGTGIQRPEYRKELTGVGQVVLTRVADRAAGLVLAEELEGVYTVVSVASGQIVARIDKEPGELRRVSLPSGRYVVRKVRRTDVLVAELDLAWGGDRWVDDAQMKALDLGDPLSRGGSFPSRPVRLTAGLIGATPMLARNPVAVGGMASVRIRLRPTLAMSVGLGFERGQRWRWNGRLGSGTGHASVGLLADRRLARVDLFAGAGVEGLLLTQDLYVWSGPGSDRVSGATRHLRQWTAGPYGQVGAHLPVGPVAGFEVGARAMVYPIRADGGRGFFAMGQAYAAVSARIGGRRVGTVKKRPR